MKTAILFDLDGTLLDTLGDLHAATNAVLRSFGYPERTMDEVRRFVGNGARVLIQQAVPKASRLRTYLCGFLFCRFFFLCFCLFLTGFCLCL